MRKLLVATFLVSCASPPPAGAPATVVVADAGAATVAPAAPVPVLAPALWKPGRDFEDIGGGRRGTVSGGRRVLLDGNDQPTTIDAQPLEGLGRGRKIPEALGGGWVFVSERTLWFGSRFDGPLTKIADLPGYSQIGFGIDRVYVKGQTFELPSGKVTSHAVPDLVQLFGLPSGQVAARTKTGEVFLSVAKGKPFSKVASGVEMIAYDGKAFLLLTSSGERRLDLDGKVGPRPPMLGMTTTDNLVGLGEFPDLTKPPPPLPLLDRIVAPHSVAMDDGHVLRVEDNSLTVFDGWRGVELAKSGDVFAGHSSCYPIRGGTPAFIGCNDPTGMALFRVDASDRPPVLERTLPKDVLTNEFGFPAPGAALVFSNRCDGAAVPGAFCMRANAQNWVDVAIPDHNSDLAGASFLASIVASREGTPYGFAWQARGSSLLIADGAARKVRVIQRRDLPEWAQDGIRWQSVTASDGRLRFLVPGEHPGVLTIDDNGKIEGRALTGHLGAVGARGLLVTPEGRLSETQDGGKSWRDVDPPPGGATGLRTICHEGGCIVGPWYRLGWSR